MVFSPSLPPSPCLCPFPVLFKIIWLSFRSLVLSLHFIWSLFPLGLWLWFLSWSSYSCPSGRGDDNLVVPASLLAPPQDLSLDLPYWPPSFLPLQDGSLVLMNPLALLLEGPSGQTYLFLLLPKRTCHIQDKLRILLHGTYSGKPVFLFCPAFTPPLLLVTVTWIFLGNLWHYH